MGGEMSNGTNSGGTPETMSPDAGLIVDGGVGGPTPTGGNTTEPQDEADAFTLITVDSGMGDGGVGQTANNGSADGSGCSCRTQSDNSSAVLVLCLAMIGVLRRRVFKR